MPRTSQLAEPFRAAVDADHRAAVVLAGVVDHADLGQLNLGGDLFGELLLFLDWVGWERRLRGGGCEAAPGQVQLSISWGACMGPHF
jgi:hypothetical protein